MRFTTRTRYGLRFLVRLAGLPERKLLRLSIAAREDNISAGYLEQIVRALKPMGILEAVRGNGGGYRLAKDADSINMEEVFSCLEGEIAPVACMSSAGCEREDLCGVRHFWREMDAHTRAFLRQRTLGDVYRLCNADRQASRKP